MKPFKRYGNKSLRESFYCLEKSHRFFFWLWFYGETFNGDPRKVWVISETNLSMDSRGWWQSPSTCLPWHLRSWSVQPLVRDTFVLGKIARIIGKSLASIITCNQRGSFIRLSTIVRAIVVACKIKQDEADRAFGREEIAREKNDNEERQAEAKKKRDIPLVYSSLQLRNLFIEDVVFKHRLSNESSGNRRESKAADFVVDLFAREKSIGKNCAFFAQIHELSVTAAATTQRWMWPTWRYFMTVRLVGPKDPRQDNDFYITLAVRDFLYCCNLGPS